MLLATLGECPGSRARRLMLSLFESLPRGRPSSFPRRARVSSFFAGCQQAVVTDQQRFAYLYAVLVHLLTRRRCQTSQHSLLVLVACSDAQPILHRHTRVSPMVLQNAPIIPGNVSDDCSRTSLRSSLAIGHLDRLHCRMHDVGCVAPNRGHPRSKPTPQMLCVEHRGAGGVMWKSEHQSLGTVEGKGRGLWKSTSLP
ncbi:hypothetical protein FA95DRAFT_515658 [Auriscalpium vulgare]|uniref:Uncharacterized protein n=1 Tax=Auriscalpium vulgare TaxID=40419 RepID=A0ACB8RFW5_9AGAM|nr:hypothetical protein FA95DRAFT_515658 [Auriscalpium vulgare]